MPGRNKFGFDWGLPPHIALRLTAPWRFESFFHSKLFTAPPKGGAFSFSPLARQRKMLGLFLVLAFCQFVLLINQFENVPGRQIAEAGPLINISDAEVLYVLYPK